mmetsp:Transcript_125547/g.349509  ORF Transcript_125547/g.349509 Transcript_125547/m.349509 type:complete len:276 (+) Transcript_125547:1-828(+)
MAWPLRGGYGEIIDAASVGRWAHSRQADSGAASRAASGEGNTRARCTSSPTTAVESSDGPLDRGGGRGVGAARRRGGSCSSSDSSSDSTGAYALSRISSAQGQAAGGAGVNGENNSDDEALAEKFWSTCKVAAGSPAREVRPRSREPAVPGPRPARMPAIPRTARQRCPRDAAGDLSGPRETPRSVVDRRRSGAGGPPSQADQDGNATGDGTGSPAAQVWTSPARPSANSASAVAEGSPKANTRVTPSRSPERFSGDELLAVVGDAGPAGRPTGD